MFCILFEPMSCFALWLRIVIAPDQQNVRCVFWCVSSYFMHSHFSVHFLWYDLFCLSCAGYGKHGQTLDGSRIRVWVQGPDLRQRQRHTHHILRKNTIWREVDGFMDMRQHSTHSGTNGSLSVFTETLHNST